MRITEAQLRRIIREELESDRYAIVALGDMSSGPAYVVAYDKDVLERKLRGEDSWGRRESDVKDYSGVIAGLSLNKTVEYGECNDAWQVSTAVSRERGWGTKVYLAAFELLRNVSPNRYSVSASAEGMWKSLTRRGIVAPEPFDDVDDPKTPPTSDDCKVFKLSDPVLNSSFKLVGSIPEEVTQLLEAGEEHLRELSRSGTKHFASMALKGGLDNLFDDVYEG
jgi:hypothetical protein